MFYAGSKFCHLEIVLARAGTILNGRSDGMSCVLGISPINSAKLWNDSQVYFQFSGS